MFHRLAISSVVVAIWLTCPPAGNAQTDATCQHCHKTFRLDEKESGLERDILRTCPRCEVYRTDLDWLIINRHRYVHFQDGTLIDLKHMRAAMLTSVLLRQLSPNFPLYAFVGANGLGWLVEWDQVRSGNPSGHPWGTNEDLYSNFAGAAAGVLVDTPLQNSQAWADSALPILEKLHGRIVKVTDTKREK